MTETTHAVVRLGGRDVDIRPLTMGKGILLSDLVGEASFLWSELDAEAREWQKEEAERRAVTFNQAEADSVMRQRRAEHGDDAAPLVPEGWDWNENPEFRIPQYPDWREALARFVPKVWRQARPQVIRLLGLLVVEDDDLWNAEDQDEATVSALLENEGRKLARSATVPEVANLLMAFAELHIMESKAAWGNLSALRSGMTTEGSPTGTTTPTNGASAVPAPSPSSPPSSGGRAKSSGGSRGGRR